jgi:hypothetical protein
MIKRNRFKQTQTLEQRLEAEACKLREQAKLLPQVSSANAFFERLDSLKPLPTYQSGSGLQGFSRRTPLNFLAVFLTAMNCPPFLLRLVEVFVSGFFNCVRFFTAPLRALSPLGLLTAINLSFGLQY